MSCAFIAFCNCAVVQPVQEDLVTTQQAAYTKHLRPFTSIMLESDNIDLPSFGAPTYFERVKFTFSRRYQKLLDDSSPYVLPRWIGAVALLLIYVLRVSAIGGYFIVSYALGIYLLNLLIGFLSPQVDPEEDASASSLPLKADDEFKPFVRRCFVYLHYFYLP